MHRTLPYISLFVVTVLLQVFLFDNLSISIYLNPLVYRWIRRPWRCLRRDWPWA